MLASRGPCCREGAPGTGRRTAFVTAATSWAAGAVSTRGRARLDLCYARGVPGVPSPGLGRRRLVLALRVIDVAACGREGSNLARAVALRTINFS
jgi:hypothetical protein